MRPLAKEGDMGKTKAAAICAAAMLFGCGGQQSADTVNQGPKAGPPFSNVADMKLLMNAVFDANADIVWAQGGTIVTKDGEQKVVPKTDEEWTRVRNAAVTVAEAGNLLMLEGRAVDRDDWMAKSRDFIDKANETVKAAEAKDIEGLFTAGGDMYLACTACHSKYVIGVAEKAGASNKQ